MDDAAFWRHVRQQLVQLLEIEDTLAEATTLAEDLQTPAQMSPEDPVNQFQRALDLLAQISSWPDWTDTEVQEGDLETDSPTNTQAQ